jgi:putative protease
MPHFFTIARQSGMVGWLFAILVLVPNLSMSALFGFGRKSSGGCCSPSSAHASPGKPIGKVSHYYDKLGVAIIDLKAALVKGDKVKFTRGEEEFEQVIDSMQLEHQDIEKAGKGKSVGVKVVQRVREGAEVYKM